MDGFGNGLEDISQDVMAGGGLGAGERHFLIWCIEGRLPVATYLGAVINIWENSLGTLSGVLPFFMFFRNAIVQAQSRQSCTLQIRFGLKLCWVASSEHWGWSEYLL